MREKILQFLAKQGNASRAPIALETNLFDAGVLDSFRLVEFVTFLEGQTGLKFSDDDLDDERFTSVAGILELLTVKGAGLDSPETDLQ